MKGKLLIKSCTLFLLLFAEVFMCFGNTILAQSQNINHEEYRLGSDIELLNLSNRDIMIYDSLTIKFALRNNSKAVVNSAVVEWRISGSSEISTQKFNNLSISKGEIVDLAFNKRYKPSGSGERRIIINIKSINGVPCTKTLNYKNEILVESIKRSANKHVLIEEATGTWCGYCVDGAVYLKKILEKHSKVIGVALHSGDKMQTTNTAIVCNAMASGYPSGFVNRTAYGGKVGLSRSLWEQKALEQLNDPTSVEIDLATVYDKANRKLKATVNVNYTEQKSGDFRINLYVVENNVTGTGSGWDQSNYYNDVVGHPMYGKGNKIVGYVHNHVVRKMAGGAWGSAGIIPNPAKGNYSYTYNVDINSGWKEKDIHIVAYVSEYNSSVSGRRIFNAIEKPMVNPVSPSSFEVYKESAKVDLSQPVVINGKPDDSELKYAFKIKNTSGNELKVKMKKEAISAVKEHSFYFCWKDCYQPSTNESSEMTIAAGDTHADELSLHLEPKSAKGISSYKITIENVNNPMDKLEFTAQFVVGDVSTDIFTDDNSKLKVFPNPVNNFVTIKGELNNVKGSDIFLRLYNTEGKLVRSVLLGGNNGSINKVIDCSNLTSGIYTYTVTTGNKIFSGRIVKR
jgi:hypothetical protein